VFDIVTQGIKKWLVGLFASAINHTTRPEDRVLAIRWLSQSREAQAITFAHQFTHRSRSNRK
jgi:hypothetical protein